MRLRQWTHPVISALRPNTAAGRRGFTLAQVTVVVLAIATGAALAVPSLLGTSCSNHGAVIVQIANVRKAAELWQVGIGVPPQQLQDLLASPGVGQSPLLDKLPVDPWGNPIYYEFPSPLGGEGPFIWSAGPNRQDEHGHGDDIFLAPSSVPATP